MRHVSPAILIATVFACGYEPQVTPPFDARLHQPSAASGHHQGSEVLHVSQPERWANMNGMVGGNAECRRIRKAANDHPLHCSGRAHH